MAHDLAGGLTGWDLEGFHNGGDTECWRRLGAHRVTVWDDDRGSISGTRFAVWAPNARQVRVNADFNWWTGDQMELIAGSGVWGLFVEGVGDGALYKFSIQDQNGEWHEKVDPMAFFAEQAPSNASIVYTSRYAWGDDDWMRRRAEATPHASPMSVYEVHLGSWKRGKTYLELAEELVEYVTYMGYTHVELLPVTEHPFEPSWGYQVTNYFAPQSRLGRPDEFRHLVDRLHQAGIGVILDWVPGHFPKDDWALGRFDGTALYEHADPRQGEHKDWGTYIFNYGRNEVKSFLVSNALYWVTEFHIDALRVDAVASMLYLDYSREEGEWVPNVYGGRENLEAIDFLRYVNRHLYARVPGVVMIAEESTSFAGVTKPVDAGGLGFGFKWNMGWMNDSLRYIEHEPIHRQYHHNLMTFAMVYAYSENFILPISHDEVVHGKGSMINKVPQDDWRKFATLRAFYSYMWSFPGKNLLFMGCDFGQRREFTESESLEWWVCDLWGHNGLQSLVRDLNEIYRAHPALWSLDSDPAGFEWINADDAGQNTFSFVRKDASGQMIACVSNFSSEPWEKLRIGLPKAGVWSEILNTDSALYDGSGAFGNLGRIVAVADPYLGKPASATVVAPPLSSVWFRYEGPASDEELAAAAAAADEADETVVPSPVSPLVIEHPRPTGVLV
ncbi:1,4-alpha-glucan branching protein GlgB [Propionicicella superfundia]|uniref:1,4-alpha-glucan branching protein GlgB n=1 Tax=Propionicicella superfundia TaxID=348582 RepID=UPI000406E1A8|nr:1,4-alpha-glucan branching protein GlgB [Propionicicella superfundia]